MTGRERSIDKDTLCHRLLGWVPPFNAYRGDCIKLAWFDINFKTLLADATTDQLIMYAQTYILHMFGDLIFTSIADNAILFCFLTFTWWFLGHL